MLYLSLIHTIILLISLIPASEYHGQKPMATDQAVRFKLCHEKSQTDPRSFCFMSLLPLRVSILLGNVG